MPDPAPLLAGWRRLRLAAAAPERVPAWDAVVLTASGPAQAALYREALAAMVRRGRLPGSTRVLVVEDPQGRRIGSGGATINALRALAASLGGAAAVARARILLVHAGGDSKRLPWAGVVGKAFIPVPVAGDPDRPCPTLLDHLAALASAVPERLAQGGMLALSGDVLPLAELGAYPWPAEGLAVAAVPAPVALAGRHGVFATAPDGRITALLQKPTPAELAAAGALLPGGLALLDTGVWSIAGRALARLAALAADAADPVAELLADGRECSLYEELPAACLPDRAAWLAGRPLGARLAAALAGEPLAALRADGLAFLHLGTGSELLEHLTADWGGARATRLLAACGPAVDDEAIVLESRCDGAARIGGGTLVAGSRLGARTRIGRRCVVQGVDAADEPLDLPDHHALWQVPVRDGDGTAWVTAWCGVDDDPKAPFERATLGNRPLADWLLARGLAAEALWPDGGERSLWTAALYPLNAASPSLAALGWMTGDPVAHAAGGDWWRGARRVSLADLARRCDAEALIAATRHRGDRVAMGVLTQVARHGLDRDAAALAADLSPGARAALAALADALPADLPVSAARRHWLRADLLAAAGTTAAASAERERAWSAIAHDLAGRLPDGQAATAPACAPGRSAACELPARIDLAGGWTDTPPVCFDQPARVLNLAVLPGGRAPIGASAAAVAEPGLHLALEGPGAPAPLSLPWTALHADGRFPLSDPYALPKAALVACGWAGGGAGGAGCGLRLRAWSHLPKGSGLGGSSILAAAIVRALARLAGRDDGAAAIAALVLTVEQRLSTGGGWQDQLGGLLPGAKLLSALPRAPLAIAIDPVPLPPAVAAALRERLVVVDTGITRLARDVLQRVVGAYLGRSHHAVRALRRLAEVAVAARDALAGGDLAALDAAIREAWSLNQTLDPHCSNPAVDALFAGLPGAWKLAGAGGGGFALWLAPDLAAATRGMAVLRQRGARGAELWEGGV